MNANEGSIKLICGPMFSGKTTALIDTLQKARAKGYRVLAIKPVQDTRYARDRIVTHDGADIPAVVIQCGGDLIEGVEDSDVIGIDEVHFFDTTIVGACEELANQGKYVICAGVDLDHRGQMFDVIAGFVATAGEVVRLSATCSVCGGRAEFTQRLVASDERIVLGGAGEYEPRCADCFDRSST